MNKQIVNIYTIAVIGLLLIESFLIEAQVSYVFLPGSTSIPETTLLSTTIYTVVPTGGDEPYTCSVTNQNPDSAVRQLDFSGLNLQTIRQFDYETTTQYVLTIECEDDSSATGTSTFTVHISDINDEDPVITGSLLANIDEELSPGTVIPVLFTATDSDAGDVLQYSLTGSDTGYFQVDSSLGTISVKTRLDRDSLSARVVFNQLTLVVTDAVGASAVVSLTITLQDINDNTPTFSPSHYYVTVTENKPAGQTLLSLSCSDQDEIPGNGDIIYSLVSGDDTPSKFTLSGNDLLTTTTPLDYDVLSSQAFLYQLIVTATDEGVTPNTGTATVFVQVLGENDGDPVWGSFTPPYTNPTTPYDIREDVSIGTTVVAMLASDTDHGEDGVIHYTLDTTTDDGGSSEDGVFRVDSVTGTLMTNILLDRDSASASSYYDVLVSARDGGSPSRSVDRVIRISITDMNDNPPTFTSSLYEININENLPVSTSLQTLSATDNDVTSSLSYTIISGNTGSKFEISGSNVLQTQSVIDLDPPNNDPDYYSLVVTVVDGGTPELTGSASVIITITPTNELTPVFTPSSQTITVSLSEDTGSGSGIATVSATDGDHGDDGLLSYSISSGDPEGHFQVTPGSGVISVKKLVDYDTLLINPLELVLTATDSGGNTDSATVTVSVLDVNDNTPVCSNTVLYAEILENLSTGSDVVSLICSDPDVSDTLTYVITSGNSGFTFSVTSSGVVQLINSVDYESGVILYNLIIDVSDGLQTETLYLTVNVLPVNEANPVFSQGEVTVTWSEDTAVGEVLTSVPATDLDSGEHGIITYIMSSASPSVIDLMSLDSSVGDLVLINSLDYDVMVAPQSYTLITTAQDGGGLQASCTVSVIVTNSNDNSPVCTPSYLIVTRPENIAGDNYPMTVVSSLSCTDSDGDTISYTMSPNTYGLLFTLEETTGEITTTGALDFETLNIYSLLISVSDAGVPVAKSTSVQVVVSISDVNDGPPIFSGTFSVVLSEAAAVGTFVKDVTADDPDRPDSPHGRLLYSLISGDTNNQFSLNRESGSVALNKELDMEMTQFYQLQIEALEESGTYSATTTLNITLSDVNDHSPECAQLTYSVFVSEQTVAGYTLLSVSCTDSDYTPASSTITYSIPVGDMTKFEMIGSDLSLQVELDYEQGIDVYNLVISAGDGLTTQDIQVTVTLLPVNEFSPILLDSGFSLAEDTAPGTVVHQITALDGDAGDDGLVLYTMDYHQKFGLDDQTGNITLTGPLDWETQTNYTLVITAYDLGSQSYNTTATITVSVIDVHDNTPIFSPAMYSLVVLENTTIGTTLVSITCSDSDAGSDITYSIVSGDPNSVFRVEKYIPTNECKLIVNNGTLFDYEFSIFFQLVVRGSDGLGLYSDADVSIQITSVNDYSPVFDPASSEEYVFENSTLGSTVIALLATDMDRGPDGNITYSMVPSERFSLHPATGVVTVTGYLDRETQVAVYLLSILAADSGSVPSSKTATYSLTIYIVDVNDMVPSCSKEVYYVVTPESTAPSTLLSQLVCNDADTDSPNNQLHYQLTDAVTTFDLDSVSGRLYLAPGSSFDREAISNYTLSILVSDMGDPPLSINVTILIDITDENDHAPVFCCSPYLVSVSEETLAGVSIIQLTATDPDSPPFGTVVYRIDSGNAGEKFVIGQSTGIVTTSGSLKSGTETQYNLTVIASDLGLPPLEASASVLLDTTVNHNPSCPALFYHTTVLENVTTLYVLLDVSCSDVDDVLSYSLTPPTFLFSVSSTSGVVSVSSPLDAETESSYTFTVIVTAGSVLRNITVTVEILDVNEASPVFDPGGVYIVTITEDTPIGTIITVINTTDADLTSDTYYYFTGGDPDNAFRINYITGTIRVNHTLNYESTSSYVLEITALDSHLGNTLSALTSVTVTLVDLNDNPPVCSPDVFKFDISETQTGSVMVLSCTDQDVGYSTLDYSILSGNENSSWILNSVTGELSINSTLDFETVSSYSIMIEVSDGTFNSDVNVFIRIEDYNEYTPVFNSLSYVVNIDEDTAVGSSIVAIQATDDDRDDTSKLIYSIEAGNVESKFILNPMTGILELTSVLNRETTALYNLTVAVCDRAEGLPEQKCSQAGIYVTVTDVNDNYPTFSSDHYFISLPETLSSGSTVLSVTVTDEDEGVNAAVTLDIVTGNVGGLFALNGSVLYLTPTEQLDYETKLSHSLIIRAVDGGSSVKSSSAIVTITVLAVNEYTPIFSANTSVTIPENTAIGTVIFTATPSDDDTGMDGLIDFSIISGNQPGTPFFIDTLSGQIQVWSGLDFDVEPSSYNLVIKAGDNGGDISGLSSSMTLTVQLTDINDITPAFSQNTYHFTITEHEAGSFIGQVIANDSDSGLNGQTEYSLISGDDIVTINKSTGEIISKLTAVLDFEVKHHHIFVVKVKDFGTPSLSTECLVYLTVLDTNDKTPLFTPSDYTVYVYEESLVSSSITQLTAVDFDTAGGGGHITFSISPATHFTVDSVTGIITLSSPLDFEVQSMHVLMVEAADQGISQLTGTGTVTVMIRDNNDNTPVITGVYDESISEDTPILTSVLTVIATDADVGENAEICFNITSGNTNSDFVIDGLSGILLVVNALDRESQTVYYPVVIAQDKGQPPRSSSVTVSITILDVNDVLPTFLDEQYYMDVREDVPVGAVIGQVFVYDNDTGVNAVLQFQLLDFTLGPPHFLVDQSSGNISTSDVLDMETVDSYVFICRVHDSGTPKLYNDISVNISVTDANDQPPVFEVPLYVWTLIDDSVAGENPLIVNVTDGDIGINAVVALSFDLTTPNGTLADSLFSPNNSVPQLQTKIIIDREVHAPFSFLLLAVDGGVPALTGSTTVSIRVLDINDNSPVFDTDYVSEEVAYDGRFTTLITMINASDSDLREAGQVTYYLVPSSNYFLFSVAAQSGEVRLRATIDSNSTYILYIGAHDSGVPELHSSTYLPVRVDSFDPSLFTVSIFLGVSKPYLAESLESFTESVSEIYQIKYPTAKARLWFIEERDEYAVDSLASRRRRRAIPAGDRAVTVHLYILATNETDSISNYYTPKAFLLATEALSFLLGPDLSPVMSGSSWANYSIIKIELYQHVEGYVSDISVTVICSVIGGVLLIILAVVGVRIYQKRMNPFQTRLFSRQRKKGLKRLQLLPLTHRNPKRREASYQTLRKDVQPNTPSPVGKTATRVDPVSGHLFQYDKRSQKVRWLASDEGKPLTVQTLQSANRKKTPTEQNKLAFDQF